MTAENKLATKSIIDRIYAKSKTELQQIVDSYENLKDLIAHFCSVRLKTKNALIRKLMQEQIDISKYHKDIDYVGKKYGELFIKDAYFVYKSGKVLTYYICLCKCGNEFHVLNNHLKSSQDCGCVSCNEIIGNKYGFLTVLGPAENTKFKKFLFLCDCGKEHIAVISDVIRGKIKSCGHVNVIKDKENSKFKGVGDIPSCFWHKILYGARQRNISVEITLQQIWDLYLKQNKLCALSGIPIYFAYSAKTINDTTASLDRIDSSKNYTIDNIQWIHKHVNTMKMAFDEKYFISICNKINNRHPNKLVITSGFYNCLHGGHLKLIKEASKLGNKLIVIVNNDNQVELKKSQKLINENDRLMVISAIKYVDEAILALDKDITVAQTIEAIAQKYPNSQIIFAKGGDRKDNNSMPKKELDICNKYNINISYGVGGFDKHNSSSQILKECGFVKDIYNAANTKEQLDFLLS
jgi:glycerol-3-phosphate cytidylyltransferase/D-beta-D-heptose 7-phosphate kinase/D-beta-D-heptose 1-phosphate adenosyltransferase